MKKVFVAFLLFALLFIPESYAWRIGVLETTERTDCSSFSKGFCIDSDNDQVWYDGANHSGSGSDTNAVKTLVFPAAALLPLEVGDNIPPLSKDAGTNIDLLVRDFDDDTDECGTVHFKVPPDVDTSGTATFFVHWYSGTATSGNIIWDFRWHEINEGEAWDAAVTTDASAADATQGTVDQITETSWTETLSNLGWTADEMVAGMVCRDANNVSDNLSGDASMIVFTIEIPRA